jgi:hypothetical protein
MKKKNQLKNGGACFLKRINDKFDRMIQTLANRLLEGNKDVYYIYQISTDS